jgi:hypothetical protein
MTTATKPVPKAKATASATAPIPTNDLPTVSAAAPEATGAASASAAAPETTDATNGTPEATNGTLQEALASAKAPTVSADAVADEQRAIFKRIIAKATALATLENETVIGMGGLLQEAIDTFKPLIPKADWWRQRADTISDFEQRYRLAMNGRTPEAYKWLSCHHVHRLASDDSKAILTTGRNGRPFPIATLDTVSGWLHYDKSNDEWTIKPGYENDLDVMIATVADDGLTARETAEAMSAIDSAKRLASAEATGGAKAKAKEEATQKAKAKADRSKAIDGAVDRFAKALASDNIGGASASEILNRLADRGLAEATGLVDPATMTPTQALAFAQQLCELDRTDVVFVILTRLRAYEANALASAQEAKAPAPDLNDAPIKASA